MVSRPSRKDFYKIEEQRAWALVCLLLLSLLFCLPVYFLHEVQWIHFYYSIHSSCYHQGWIFWVEHYFCYGLIWRTENIHEQRKTSEWVLHPRDSRRQWFCGLYSSGALSRSELRRDLHVKELWREFYKNSNSRNCYHFEWNREIISQNFKIRYKYHSK